MSRISMNLDKQMVLRVNRLIRVRNVRCSHLIFWVLRLPGWCSSESFQNPLQNSLIA